LVTVFVFENSFSRTKTKSCDFFFLVKKVFGKLKVVLKMFGQLFSKQFSLKNKTKNCLAFLYFFVLFIYCVISKQSCVDKVRGDAKNQHFDQFTQNWINSKPSSSLLIIIKPALQFTQNSHFQNNSFQIYMTIISTTCK